MLHQKVMCFGFVIWARTALSIFYFVFHQPYKKLQVNESICMVEMRASLIISPITLELSLRQTFIHFLYLWLSRKMRFKCSLCFRENDNALAVICGLSLFWYAVRTTASLLVSLFYRKSWDWFNGRSNKIFIFFMQKKHINLFFGFIRKIGEQP